MRNELFEPNEVIFLEYLKNSATSCFANQTVILREPVSPIVTDKLNGKLIFRQGWIITLPDGKMAGVRLIKERIA